jgi:hypothetical protein
MRCEDLTRELASPTGGASPADIAGHLAACPSCAEWSRRAARFDQIWEATRPPEPSSGAMDALWARASAALDEVPSPATLRLEGPARRRWGWAKPAFAVAQAAAVLVAALFLLRQAQDAPVASPKLPIKAPVAVNVTVDLDQYAIVRLDKDDGLEVEVHEEAVRAASTSIPYGTQHEFFNEVEGMASNPWGSMASR